jgi:hypothetical protein
MPILDYNLLPVKVGDVLENKKFLFYDEKIMLVSEDKISIIVFSLKDQKKEVTKI